MVAIVVACSNIPSDKILIDAARAQARLLDDGKVVLVHYMYLPVVEDDLANPSEEHRKVAERRKQIEARIGDSLRDTSYQVSVTYGPHERPGQMLLDAIARHSPSILVLGIRRRSRVGKLLLGSTAQDLLLGANSPVLAIKLPK